MTTGERFLAEQLENSALELATVREKLKELTARLAEAENSLRFYSDPKNYFVLRNPSEIQLQGRVFQDRLMGDHSQADNDPNTLIAGNRARRYFEDHAK